jgi:glycosyltransferase involved in cell wall biosynthesis
VAHLSGCALYTSPGSAIAGGINTDREKGGLRTEVYCQYGWVSPFVEHVNLLMTNPNRLKVLVVSHLYPYRALGVGKGNFGTFVCDQVKALHNSCDLRVVIPFDCFPRREHYQLSRLRNWWTQVLRLPQKFNNDGIDLDLVRFVAPPPRRHFLFGYGAAAFLPVLRRIREIRRQFPFDVIHAHTAVPDGILAIWLGELFGVPSVITSHQGDVELVPSNQWNRATLRYTLGHADRVIAVSSALRNSIISLGVSEQQVVVVPNGFDPVKFYPGGGVTARRKSSEKIVLFIGQLVQRKDPLILLRALPHLRERLPNLRLIILGDGPLRKQIEDYILQLDLRDSVELVGEIPHSKVPEYIRSADLLCLPSHAEGWPTVIFEGLSQGVPVVASAVGGIPEAICSEDFGLLVEPGDLAGLTEALYWGLTKSWDTAKISRYALEFTWEKIAARIEGEYQYVVQQTSHGVHKSRVEPIEFSSKGS